MLGLLLSAIMLESPEMHNGASKNTVKENKNHP